MPNAFSPDTPPPALSPAQQELFVRELNAAHALLLRYAMSLVGNRHDGEDVLQRASVIMWRRFGEFEPGTDFVAWATTVVFYEARNFQRVAGHCRLKFDDDLMKTLAAERAQHVRQWPARVTALQACVEKLEPMQRNLVEEIYTRGVEAAELARQEGRAVQTIYNKLNFIRRALAECVQRSLTETHL
ncbi:RNA polymerase, sigma-24 subunit, ECF subfamily [Chthoniobacter flavus Ellin428]|uniref:RNA polymerase, sigma-24 subunit, ECF subfamily n=1 Tax=Chthoniobacter flavus Ellin428 TaxID=497964 RepID=B4CUT1_9BACT|nr:sigma-70 family RNA polymerase sigma factor [Chthoniobacter flavus]EDY22319.1 RNA polymerase, sigma-24 subunit, ECF subfamily [Chthoniobacter flavus Ellin428]TCO94667.1 RNA polymerase sigma-70 factor (ECF subfamily) [Chthoniobacter flavus]